MDIEENYESQPQPIQQQQTAEQQRQQQQQHQQQQLQQQQMQCDPIYTTTTMTTTTTDAAINPLANNTMMDISNNSAIPLPGPPATQPLMSTTSSIIPTTTTTIPPLNANSIVKAATLLPTNDYDIDSVLLQQFSCMGTTDHEDLISQFQSLMNNQMNRETARFYLEMSNWNLQTALGCYLDFCSLQSMPSMKIVQLSQLSALQQAFRLQNDGTERWPNGCFLTSPIQTQRINVPSIRSGETCDILADIMPTQPPIMWRLCTPNGWYFGDTIWMIPPGMQASQDELQQRMVQLITSEVKPEGYPQMNIVITANTQ